ncbi:ATP-dependent RNA helicase DBP2-like [Mizuhopecten yessoensis]|uniref:RNA helicase n=1 Tax=Mizuhopecten yessoensis TaxID=6573 RepID=A0A210QGI2_MIZYE|nr:ATP-dependent RNA helicase DBP2-like [Mizuhopecten yessoensis]OWF47809.1 ATP-dependent RNA helicase DBP2 [Mizuhopecten yessoensis]
MAARVLSAFLRTKSPYKPLKSFHSCTLLLSKDAETKSMEHENEDNKSILDKWEDVSHVPENNQYYRNMLEESNIKNTANPKSYSSYNDTSSSSSQPRSYSSHDYNVTGSPRSQPRSYSSQDYNVTDSFRSQPRSYSSQDYNDTGSSSYRPRNSNIGGFDRGSNTTGFDFEGPVDSPGFDPNILKDVYEEHSNTATRTQEEIERFYADNKINMMGSKDIKPILSFDEITGMEQLLSLIRQKGWKEPFPIQSVTWPVALSGRDMVGIAKTGSGKTLGFVLPAILHIMKQRIGRNPSEISPSVLVMSPTRELTQQVESVVKEIAPEFGIRSGCAYGGAAVRRQLSDLRGADICIATPGRLNDYLTRGQMNLNRCSYVVLDEADRMLDMGFEIQIKQILRHVKPNRQMLMWSATWPREIQALAKSYLTDPVHIRVGSMELMTNPDITEEFIKTANHRKFESLCKLLMNIATNYPDGCKTLVFVQTKRTANELSSQLMAKGIPSYALHGDKSQGERDQIMDLFRKKKKILLIATDIASRGLDVVDISNVINYDMSSSGESYVHRVGRTARGGRKGKSFSFITDKDYSVLQDLQKMYKRQNKPVPDQILDILGMSTSYSGNRFGQSRQFGSTPKFIDPKWRE